MNDLSSRLKQGTRAIHAAAEGTPFMRRLLRKTLGRDAYVRLLEQLRHVYIALEAEVERHREHPVVRHIHVPALFRATSLEEDLRFFLGVSAIQAEPAPCAATFAYVERIQEIGRDEPALLVGHAYTRYLGDLSGGQILRGLVRQGLALPEGRGTAFYEFPEIDDIGAFKREYRAALDALPVSAEAAARIVGEAHRAFQLNIGLFDALDRMSPAGQAA